MNNQNVIPFSLFSDFDINLFKSGKHYKLHEKLGSHIIEVNGVKGVYFAVWAPTAHSVSVVGDFNFWTMKSHELFVRWDESGIWEGFIPNLQQGEKYKYKIQSNNQNIITEKADPFAFYCETPPHTASVVWDIAYKWQDDEWLKKRQQYNALDKPYAVYEVHLASWMKNVEKDRSLTYLEHADKLVKYVAEMGYTHIEFMPIMEYPYDPSWGYQLVGYFAPTSRFGKPQDFKFLIDVFHQNNIGVILDWVPSHFPEDAHGLGFFDGSSLYEHPDRRRGYHPDWKSLVFNYGRNEVKSFLISNAIFWMQEYHADALRVDAVASMLYLDYSRNEGEWEPNIYGGNENLEAIAFIKEFNEAVYGMNEGVQTIAEESTSFSNVSKPTSMGGLGFGMKWMMGWMHDTLEYFKKEPIHRQYHHNQITFSLAYTFSENFMLPLSHDEVVYGKKSILGRMPGDEWQRFANLRLLYGLMYMHPGTKLMFMGCEFGQYEEWQFDGSLDWHLLHFEFHKGVQNCVKSLNHLYKNYPALHQHQFSFEAFEWINYDDAQNSVMAFIRKSDNQTLIGVFNFTPVIRESYMIGLPYKVTMKEIFNSDAVEFGGSGYKSESKISVTEQPWHGKPFSTKINVTPLSAIVFIVK